MSSQINLLRFGGPVLAAFVAIAALAAAPADAGGPSLQPLVFGNPDGNLTIVEFLDYQCPSCKALHTRLLYRVRDDGDLRLEIREIAIVGPGSVYAAHAAMAAGKQGKRNELHVALVRFRGTMSERNVLKISELTGLDLDALKTSIGNEVYDATLKANLAEGIRHQLSGTPAFLIGDRFLQGPTLDQVMDAIDEARRNQS